MSRKSPSERIKPLQHIAENRTEQAAAKLALSQRRAAEADAKLQELRKYLRDYQSAPVGGLSGVLLENRRAFLARLREAETFQTTVVSRAQSAIAEERQRWLQQRREQQVLEKLAELYRGREHLAEAQHAQKQMDEHALRSLHRKTEHHRNDNNNDEY